MNPTTRRQFLAQTAGAGVLGWRALHAQAPQSIPVPGLEAGEVTKTFALRNVTVIDGTGKPAQRAMTVVISGTRIQSVQRSDDRLAAGMPTVDASGKFLIPGLWDMHVHLADIADVWVAHFIANGVTGVRVMGGNPEVRPINEETAAGKRLGPRMILGSRILEGAVSTTLERPESLVTNSPAWRYPATAEEGRAAVRDEIRNGARFIKVYNHLKRDSYFAIADEARRRGVAFVGHCPYTVMLAECVAARQQSIEHLTGVMTESSSAWASFKKAIVQTGRAPGTPPDLKTIVDTFDDTRATAVVSLFRNSRTWHCPTLTVMRGRSGDSSLADDPRVQKYVSRARAERWATNTGASNPLPIADRLRFFAKEFEMVGELHRAGAVLIAGTDSAAANAYCIAGFSLHDELQLLVRAGLSSMEALRSATYRPAEFLGLLGSVGTVERGKLAELVLLDADPLDDIANTTKINMVFTGGRVYKRPALDSMLSAVEAHAGSPAQK